MTTRARLLCLLHPAELALRDWVVPRLDASMLDQIAAADYGFGVPEHRDALAELCQVRRLPDELAWHPAEVLRLSRWSTEGDPARQRMVRLFCGLVLVHTRDDILVDSLTPLVEASVDLGPDAAEPAAAYLAWVRLHELGNWRDDLLARPVLTLALVVLATLLPAGRDPELLPGLMTTFLDELDAALTEENLAWSDRPVRDLLKRTALAQSRRTWRCLASRCLLGEAAQLTGHGAPLAVLGRAVRDELAADVTELRALLTR